MIQGVVMASVWSEDMQAKLLPFYRDVVGLTVAIESPGFVVFGDMARPVFALGTHSDVHGVSVDSARHMIALGTDDCVGESARLEAAGVELIEEPTRTPNGITISTFRDPEGNLIQLMQFDHPLG